MHKQEQHVAFERDAVHEVKLSASWHMCARSTCVRCVACNAPTRTVLSGARVEASERQKRQRGRQVSAKACTCSLQASDSGRTKFQVTSP